MLTALRAKIKITPLQLFVYLLGLFPALWLVWDGINDNLTVNPIQALTQRSGRYAIFFLILSLACTPINTVFGFRSALKVRRALGLMAFSYALLHFVLFVGVDYQFNLDLLKGVILEKPYALVGLSAFIVLSTLALTSFRWWMKRMGKVWKRIHRFVYLAGILVVIHYFWVVKGDLFRLSGDIAKPLLYAVILTVLLLLRVPTVRKFFANLRQRLGGLRRRKPRTSAPIPQD